MTENPALELSESLEDYLEAIFQTILEKQFARPKDITQRLKVSGASVTTALKTLADRKLINYVPYECVTLTAQGEAIAEDILHRHEQLRSFLRDTLQVEAGEADATACRMEHIISSSIIRKLVRFAHFIENCPRGGKVWISGFETQCDQDASCANCLQCVNTIKEKIVELQEANALRAKQEKRLSELKAGEAGRICRINLSGAALHRLLQTGATLGTAIEVDRCGVGEDFVTVKIKGTCVSMGKKEADLILLDVNQQDSSKNPE